MKQPPKINFGLAQEIAEKLLQGKGPKQVAYELDCHVATVRRAKHYFPLFFGLKRGYKARTEE